MKIVSFPAILIRSSEAFGFSCSKQALGVLGGQVACWNTIAG